VRDVEDVLVGDFRAHGNLGGFLDLLLDLLGQHVRQVGGGRVGPQAHHLHRPDEGQVVHDDLSHFGKMPAVPLAAAHDVIVQLLVQVVQQRDSLSDKSKRLSPKTPLSG